MLFLFWEMKIYMLIFCVYIIVDLIYVISIDPTVCSTDSFYKVVFLLLWISSFGHSFHACIDNGWHCQAAKHPFFVSSAKSSYRLTELISGTRTLPEVTQWLFRFKTQRFPKVLLHLRRRVAQHFGQQRPRMRARAHDKGFYFPLQFISSQLNMSSSLCVACRDWRDFIPSGDFRWRLAKMCASFNLSHLFMMRFLMTLPLSIVEVYGRKSSWRNK